MPGSFTKLDEGATLRELLALEELKGEQFADAISQFSLTRGPQEVVDFLNILFG
jgi:hypothetical protein